MQLQAGSFHIVMAIALGRLHMETVIDFQHFMNFAEAIGGQERRRCRLSGHRKGTQLRLLSPECQARVYCVSWP